MKNLADNLASTLASSLEDGLGLGDSHTQAVAPLDLAEILFPWPWADYQAETLLALLAPDWRRMIWLAPPRHRKTTILSLFAACFVGEDPCRRVMVASHTKDFAALLIKSIVDIMGSPLYQRSYGDLLPKSGDDVRWTTYEKHLPRRPVYVRDPTFIALSPDSGTPGYGADLVLLDDVVSQANSATPTMRKHISQWIAGSLLKRLEPEGKFLITGNRFYPQDYYGEVIETKKHWKKLIHISTPEKPLWPDHWDGDAIQAQRDDDPIFYYGQYLMEPLDLASAGHFRSDWFQFYTALPPLLTVFSGIDLPITADEGTSKYAEVTMGRNAQGTLYLLDGYSGYHDGDELPDLMDTLYNNWQPIEVAWESNGPQKTVMKLSAKLVKTDIRFHGIPSEISKDRRLASIAGLVRTGKVLVRGAVNEAGKIEPVGVAKTLLDAWDDFPTGDLDLLDAFEKCVTLSRKSPPPASASTSGRSIEEKEAAHKKKRRRDRPRHNKTRYPRVFR